MPKQYSPQSEDTEASKKLDSIVGLSTISAAMTVPAQDQTGATSGLCTVTPTCVQLDWEDLPCFEVVSHQFQQWGVIFTNAIALHPSNPAFPCRSGATVIMGVPKSGWIEARFLRPVCFVGGFVTCSRRTVLSAYDLKDSLLAQAEISGPNLAGSGSTIAPNAPLHLQAPNIHRITFSCFDGQFTLDDFRFSF